MVSTLEQDPGDTVHKTSVQNPKVNVHAIGRSKQGESCMLSPAIHHRGFHAKSDKTSAPAVQVLLSAQSALMLNIRWNSTLG